VQSSSGKRSVIPLHLIHCSISTKCCHVHSVSQIQQRATECARSSRPRGLADQSLFYIECCTSATPTEPYPTHDISLWNQLANLFDQFFAIVQALEIADLRSAVVGGIAMAFHDNPRLTRDVDLLVHPRDVARVSEVLKPLGFLQSTESWTFSNAPLT